MVGQNSSWIHWLHEKENIRTAKENDSGSCMSGAREGATKHSPRSSWEAGLDFSP